MTASELAFSQIETLVRMFKALSSAEVRGMNEHATGQGFILPMFRALGWNTDNINETSPEEKVSRGSGGFFLPHRWHPRFFLESKKRPPKI